MLGGRCCWTWDLLTKDGRDFEENHTVAFPAPGLDEGGEKGLGCLDWDVGGGATNGAFLAAGGHSGRSN